MKTCSSTQPDTLDSQSTGTEARGGRTGKDGGESPFSVYFSEDFTFDTCSNKYFVYCFFVVCFGENHQMNIGC